MAVERAEHGTPPGPWLELVAPPSPQLAAVLAFPGHVIVAADVPRPWLESWIPPDDYCTPTGPPFLAALEELIRLEADSLDVLLLGAPLAGARHPLPDDRPAWAQCAPGNAASLRALLGAGYLPVGSEVLLTSPRRPASSPSTNARSPSG